MLGGPLEELARLGQRADRSGVRRGGAPLHGGGGVVTGEREVVRDLSAVVGSSAEASRSCSPAGSARSAYTASRNSACRKPSRPVVGRAARRRRPLPPPPRASPRRAGRARPEPAAGRQRRAAPASARPAGETCPTVARTAVRRFGGGAVAPAATARALSTASSGLPSAAAITRRSASSSSVAIDRASAATASSAIGARSSSVTVHPSAREVGQHGVQLGRVGRSRRVRTSSSGSPASRRAMCAVSRRLARSARCASSSASSSGRSVVAHSTSRSTDSKTRSRSSSGAATPTAGPAAPEPAPRSGESRFSSVGHTAPAGTGATVATSARASSSQAANGVSPPTSMPGADRGPAAGGADPVGQLGEQAGLADAGLAGQDDDLTDAVGGRPPCGPERGQLLGAAEQPAAAAAGSGRAQLRLHRAGRRRRPHAQLGAQQLGELPAGHDRGGAVTGRAQPAQQVAVRGLVQRRERAPLARPAHGLREPAHAVGLGQLAARAREQPAPVLVAGGADPVVVDAGQQLAAGRARRVVGERVHPHVPAGKPDRRSRSPTSAWSAPAPQAWRRDQTAVRRLARALASGTSGHSRAARSIRGCGPGCRPSQPIRARARSLVGIGSVDAVELAGEPAAEPQPQHRRSVGP